MFFSNAVLFAAISLGVISVLATPHALHHAQALHHRAVAARVTAAPSNSSDVTVKRQLATNPDGFLYGNASFFSSVRTSGACKFNKTFNESDSVASVSSKLLVDPAHPSINNSLCGKNISVRYIKLVGTQNITQTAHATIVNFGHINASATDIFLSKSAFLTLGAKINDAPIEVSWNLDTY